MVETRQDEDMFRICDHGGMSLGLFAQRVSTGTPELTLRHEFRSAAEHVSAFMCQQNFFLSVSESYVCNVRGARLLRARGARA